MKQKLFILFLILFSTNLLSQKTDKIISTSIYTSYFSYQTHTPLYVVYKLYKGGGKSSRNGMEFNSGGIIQSATTADYKSSGYDIGHMANAEDFAYNSKLEELTFRFYNALPQLPKLNRGIWKHFETEIRKQSQTDSLLIICGGYNFNKKLNNKNVEIPDMCFKIVKNIRTKQIQCYIFPNDNSDSYKEINIQQLYILSSYNFDKIIK